MLNYLFKRILSLIPVLIILSIVIFSLIHMTGGSPAASILGMEATQVEIDELNEKLGINKPVYIRYISWVKGVIRGDLGESFFMEEDVKTAIKNHMAPTIELAITAIFLTVAISIPIGIVQAYGENSFFDKITGFFNLIGFALPSFVISIILMFILGVVLKILPVAGYYEPSKNLFMHIKYMILPAFSLAVGQSAYLIKTTRASFVEEMDQTYIKTARNKGYSDFVIIFREIFKNALLPIITVIGQSFGSLVVGAIIVETIFNIPGLGKLLINSLARRDIAMIQGIVLVSSLLYIFINLITDIIYSIVDPRIRYEE